MLKVKEIDLWNRLFIIASKDDRLAYFGIKDHALRDLTKDFPKDEIVECDEGFEAFEQQLGSYIEGTLKEFTVPLYMSGTPFQKEVYEELYKVPFGETISYSELADRVGDVRKVRAVANAVGKNRHLIIMPCHRIISKDGSLGGFSAGLDLKEILLKHEGKGDMFK